LSHQGSESREARICSWVRPPSPSVFGSRVPLLHFQTPISRGRKDSGPVPSYSGRSRARWGGKTDPKAEGGGRCAQVSARTRRNGTEGRWGSREAGQPGMRRKEPEGKGEGGGGGRGGKGVFRKEGRRVRDVREPEESGTQRTPGEAKQGDGRRRARQKGRGDGTLGYTGN
jgi:hypothetical protein